MNNLRRIDVNLLITLDALLSEHNVTRTAARLNFSQPSVSAHLAKLRDIFKDPLLLPGPRGMRSTARADALREPLRDALNALEQVVLPSNPFDPAVATQTWRIAASDYSELTVMRPAIGSLRSVAPGTRLAIVQVAPLNISKQAERGEIDLAFHVRDEGPNELRCRVLFSERYVLVGRADHPRLRRRPTLSQFCQLDHVIVSPNGGGFNGVTDEALMKIGLSRRVVLSVPHFLFAMSVVEDTDMVALLPERLIREAPGLRVVEPPLSLPGYELAMFWHERSHRDPAHRWLREYIVNSIQDKPG
jgi:DNA-binding transcriptional LysR family regulator